MYKRLKSFSLENGMMVSFAAVQEYYKLWNEKKTHFKDTVMYLLDTFAMFLVLHSLKALGNTLYRKPWRRRGSLCLA